MLGLSAFTDQYRADNLTPLLHLETHGNEDGIGTEAEGIAWRDLAEALVPLNHATRMKLVINLAACLGVYGTTMLRPEFGPAPFRGLIGPRRELDETEVWRVVARSPTRYSIRRTATCRRGNSRAHTMAPPLSVMALSIGGRLGHYQILSALGAGGTGQVFRARDTRLNRDVAIKNRADGFASDRERLARVYP